jgi:hypothetical protein
MKIDLLQKRFDKEYFLILLPFYFFFHGLVQNYESVLLTEVVWLTAKYVLATFILTAIFFLVFRSWRKTALYVFALMAFNFFFGALHDTSKQILPNSFLVKYVFILPFIFLLIAAVAIWLYRSKKRFAKAVIFFNLVLLVFILIDIPGLFSDIAKANQSIHLAKEFQSCTNCAKPDVYLIVADEYAGKQELKDIFGFDNSPFENFLQSKGFHIIPNSRSNYNYTDFSTSSMLSMNFLHGIEGSNSSRHDLNICYGLINKNSLWNFFKANGYTVKNYSIFNVDNISTPAPQDQIVIGSRLITSQTFLSRVEKDLGFNLVTRFKIKSAINKAKNHIKDTNEKLYDDLLKEAQQDSKQPRFVYTHLMMPHFPYYFDRNGKEYPIELIMQPNHFRKKEYIEYLQFCNKKFITLIDSLLANVKKPSIIIFMGDHGWRHFTEKADRQYHFMNLNSIYLPDKSYAPFYDGMSNVNMFRVLLNSQFNQKLPLLKDSMSFLRE